MDLQTDYFRAADEAAVRKVMTGGERPAAEVFESVRARGIDPTVVLPRLVSALREEDAPAPVKDGPDRSVWPTGLQPWHEEAPATAVDFEDPWMTGPWVVELSDETRDALAGVQRKRLPRLTSQWARTEEVKSVERIELMKLIHQLGVLARRAQQDGQHLYCVLTA
ncbi:hypothetical protein K353_02874 [Kitasatospora sp. SolWspMP-SS2h]|uniref:hypothetical protein n=1 Tax=Kitasatospora sp. SolWspMP-SS2h TaxID=1305729 RepID=UPI000DB9F004|nr:hypothetical protein [Kitasatospora sp. SolWspMP-SS2h]RAJ41763.1 hypothetical protein K353_02874 [Kitasatospora sp. SolWspMP-SS2h]